MLFRCSSLDRILRCNGSILLAPAVEQSESGVEAVEGQFLHWLAHAKLATELGAVGDIGPSLPPPPNIQLSAWIADFYFATVKALVPADWSLESEASLDADFDLPRPVDGQSRFTLTGHPDDIAMNADATEAIGFDLKCGYIPVDSAECNEQVFGYAVLLLEAYPSLRKITYYIVQPRNDEDMGFQRISEPMILEGERLDRARETFVERINRAVENWFETDSGIKQCRWCPVAMNRPWLCPSLKLEQMKANFTKQDIEAFRAAPDDGKLADFVLAGRTIAGPTDAAEELLKERIAAQGYVDSASGARITIKVSRGAYEVTSPLEFLTKSRALLGTDDRIAQCFKPSVTKVKEQIADAKGIPKTSKKETSAESVFDAELRPFVTQGERKTLVISNT